MNQIALKNVTEPLRLLRVEASRVSDKAARDKAVAQIETLYDTSKSLMGKLLTVLRAR